MLNAIIKTVNDNEILEYKERKYQQVLYYFKSTDLNMSEIYSLVGFTNDKNSAVRYVRERLRVEGYDTLKRSACIKKGEWL